MCDSPADPQRFGLPQGASDAVDAQPSCEEEGELRNMILAMVDEPLAILIKLADRLHNMRTVTA
jgi:(p)ppGpp synthase/HD superfamily hydrolase